MACGGHDRTRSEATEVVRTGKSHMNHEWLVSWSLFWQCHRAYYLELFGADPFLSSGASTYSAERQHESKNNETLMLLQVLAPQLSHRPAVPMVTCCVISLCLLVQNLEAGLSKVERLSQKMVVFALFFLFSFPLSLFFVYVPFYPFCFVFFCLTSLQVGVSDARI